MWIFIIAVIVVVSLALLGVVVRDISREISGMDPSSRSATPGQAKDDQKAMADRKITKHIEEWRDGK
jgi:flagellar basal body-associated protein FliL